MANDDLYKVPRYKPDYYDEYTFDQLMDSLDPTDLWGMSYELDQMISDAEVGYIHLSDFIEVAISENVIIPPKKLGEDKSNDK